MSGDRFPTWDDIDRENNARAEEAWRENPWRFAPRPEDIVSRGRMVAPIFPKGHPVSSTCTECPYARCAECPWEKAWRAEDARRAAKTSPPPSWWARMTARLRRGDNR